MGRHDFTAGGPRHATAARRGSLTGLFEEEIALVGAWCGGLLRRALEPVFRFGARPTAAQILEMRSWRSEFPELRALERELETGRASGPPDVVPAPFEVCRTDRGSKRRTRSGPGSGLHPNPIARAAGDRNRTKDMDGLSSR